MNGDIGWEVVEHPTAEEVTRQAAGLPTEHQEIAAQLLWILRTNTIYNLPQHDTTIDYETQNPKS